MSRIVGIGGLLRHGKDAVADRLVDKHGWVKIGMSDALAEALYVLNPYIPVGLTAKKDKRRLLARLFDRARPYREEFTAVIRYQDHVDEYGYVKAKENDEVRRLLQVLGTEVGRKIIRDSTWTDIVVRRAKQYLADGAPGVIITGIRFPNEITMIDDLDGETWWVHRRGLEASANASHASENSVGPEDFDRVVLNNGTLGDLYATVDELVN